MATAMSSYELSIFVRELEDELQDTLGRVTRRGGRLRLEHTIDVRHGPLDYLDGVWDTLASGSLHGLQERSWRGVHYKWF